jgi:glyoxylase-like metal-dependent hydrolase (beta-lactamase superfamily II)
MDGLETQLTEDLARLGVPARPIVVPTSWAVGPVIAYAFVDDPVTLIDAGLPSGRDAVERVLEQAGRAASDVARVIVTHAHGDHLGGAAWLQDVSGCEVVMHAADIAMITERGRVRSLLEPLGFDAAALDSLERRRLPRLPELTPAGAPLSYDVANRRLTLEHRPGHTPGHLWITDDASGAIFAGDYLLATGPTNPGLWFDAREPGSRAALLDSYLRAPRELAERNPPAVFGGHGPPVTDVAGLVRRRTARIERRTRRVLDALSGAGEVTPAELADRMYRGRARGDWDVMAELVGHLDLLVAQRRAASRLRQDGYWHFRAVAEGGPHA